MIRLVIFIILSLICFNQERMETGLRSPASIDSSRAALDSIQKICDDSKENDSSYIICAPYSNAKEKLEKESNKYMKSVTETLSEPVTALSGFVLKSVYEKKVKVEVKTGIGTPSVSFSNNETDLGWKFNYSF